MEKDMSRFHLKFGDKVLAHGCFFAGGTNAHPRPPFCVVAWLGEHPSVVLWNDFRDFLEINVEMHVGREVVFLDGEPLDYYQWAHHM